MQLQAIGIQFRVANLPREAERSCVLLQLALEDQIRGLLVVVDVVLFELRSTLLLDFICFLIDGVEDSF